MLPGKTYTPDDIVRIAWKRKWLIALPAVALGVAAVCYSRTLPDQYRSETTILIVPQRVPESYVRATVTSRIEDRLPSLRQQILSRERLEQTIDEFTLYAEERKTRPLESIVDRMRNDINVDIVRGDTFSVSYISTDPRAAMLVAQRLASQFIEENVREREVLAEGTNAFLETQLVDARRRLEDHEHKLAEYRRLHSGELPSQLDSNLQILNNLNLQIHGISNELERDRDRRLAIERTLDDGADLVIAGSAPAAAAGAVTAADRLEEARAQAAELRTRLTPEHPDIAAARRRIEQIERELASEAAAPAAARTPDVAPVLRTTSARQRRIQEGLAERDNVDRQIARKQQELVRLQGLVTNYQERVEATPARESELIALTRDYETLQNIYTSLLAKREDSAVAANLERRQVGEQFKVLDAARQPQRPFSPNRLQFNLIGLLAGIVAGIGLAGLLEYRDASLKTEDDVRSCLALPVLAAIPVLAAAPSHGRHKTVALGAYRIARWLIRGDAGGS